MKEIVLLLLTIGVFAACEKETNSVIDDELTFYFDLFESEATERGIILDMESINLSAYVEDIEERCTLGQCKTYSDGAKEVVIDEPNWNNISTIQKEYIVFHELGHCVLDRSHSNERGNDGSCLSIMQSGSGGCRGIYNLENRELLLNELFEF